MGNSSNRPVMAYAALVAAGAACAGELAPVSVRPFAADRAARIEVAYDARANAYALQAAGADTVVYGVNLADPDVAAGMLRVTAARDAGMLVCLHENYTDMYPDNSPAYPSPMWDASAIALDRRGNRKLGWYQPETHEQALQIAAGRMRELAQAESAAMAAACLPNAAYLDVTTGYRPDWTIDHNAAAATDHSLANAARAVIELFEAMKVIHGGPLFGEGGEGSLRFDTHFAGFVDAVERQIDRRSRALVAPLYELVAIKPRMFNHGMGYYSRYFPDAGQQALHEAQADLDQYRASEMAFGHAGWTWARESGEARARTSAQTGHAGAQDRRRRGCVRRRGETRGVKGFGRRSGRSGGLEPRASPAHTPRGVCAGLARGGFGAPACVV